MNLPRGKKKKKKKNEEEEEEASQDGILLSLENSKHYKSRPVQTSDTVFETIPAIIVP